MAVRKTKLLLLVSELSKVSSKWEHCVLDVMMGEEVGSWNSDPTKYHGEETKIIDRWRIRIN